MEDLSGKELGQYRIVAPCGEGGMAAVYKAFQPGTERYVALKILPRHYAKEAGFQERFQQEAQIIAKFQHPHILPVFDYGEEDDYAFLAMPFIEGGTLAEMINGGMVDYQRVRRVISQVGDALDYAHSYDVIHRDIKPTNILIDERQNALLTDFGISKIVGDLVNITATGQVIGTPAYMSPEQIKGETLDGRSDIYSLGIVLYEMVTGRTPYRADTPPALFVKHLLDPLPPPSALRPDVPPAVEKVILKSLAKGRDDRYQTAADMVQAVQRAIEPAQTNWAAAAIPAGAAQPNNEIVVDKTTVEFEEAASTPGKTARGSQTAKRLVIGAAVLMAAVIAAFFVTRNAGPDWILSSGLNAILPTGNTPLSAVDETALLGYWAFDEGQGSVTADSAPAGNQNDGRLMRNPSWAAGHAGQAIGFQAQEEQYVQIANNQETLSIPRGDITISAWINPSTVDGERAIVAKDKILSSSRGNYFFAVENGHLQFGFQPLPTGADVWINTKEPVLEHDQWQHTAVTFTFGSGEKPKIYLDGLPAAVDEWQGSGDQDHLPFTHENFLYIGRSEANGIYFDGLIDEVRIYNQVLAPEEIEALAR